MSEQEFGYKAFYRGRQTEVRATSSYKAQQKAAIFFKAKKSFEVSVVLCERPDGSQVVHVAVD